MPDDHRLSVAHGLRRLHLQLAAELQGVDRVAVAVVDQRGNSVRTFVHSTDAASPLTGYEVALDQVPSLVEAAEQTSDRVIDDLRPLAASGSPHSLKLAEAGYRSSLTRVLRMDGGPRAFVFLDSRRVGFFDAGTRDRLQLFMNAVGLLLESRLLVCQVLRSSLGVATELSRLRDGETGAHLDRMARFSRIIATELPDADDEFAEFLFLFAPLHDIGKVGVPDRILLKQGPLDEDETDEMRRHVETGTEVIDSLLRSATVSGLPNGLMLRNVVRHHHEAVDGSGYPDGLAGDEIPIEARIVTVADVFDALTTARPYKTAWSVDRAFAYLEDAGGRRFDAGAVAALRSRIDLVLGIMKRFAESRPAGPMNDVPEIWESAALA